MLKGQPKGLFVLALANMGERFGYYTMLAIFVLYMQAKFGFSTSTTSTIFGGFLALVYFLPLFGGLLADKVLGYGKTVALGIVVMFCGYLLLAVPSGTDTPAMIMMFGALALIALGTGFFKGNLQVLVGNLYDDPKYASKRDLAFSIFYMCINIGAFFAPSAAEAVSTYFLAKDGYKYNTSTPAQYHQLAHTKDISPEGFANLAKASGTNGLAVADFYKFTEQTKPAVADSLIPSMQNVFASIATTNQIDSIEIQLEKTIKEHFVNAGVEEVLLTESAVAGMKKSIMSSFTPISDTVALRKAYAGVREQGYKDLGSKLPEGTMYFSKKENSVVKKINATLTAAVNQKVIKAVDTPKLEKFGEDYTASLSKSYNYGFAVACLSLIFSMLVFLLFRRYYASADKTEKQKAQAADPNVKIVELTPEQTKDRLVALGLVFAVVIFFWMAFHQNGLTMTFFARDYTQTAVSGFDRFGFSLLTLVPFAVCFYGLLSVFQSTTGRGKAIGALVAAAFGGLAYYAYSNFSDVLPITPQIFQQFNAYFIVILTPIAVAFFSFLSKRGKEPLAPRKIGIGMVIAALGFIVLAVGSLGLPTPSAAEAMGGVEENMLVSPNWLISTYFVLTIAELFLSPMGISFVSKVAPPKYKGLMMGGWLAATAVGNYLVAIIGYLWGGLELWLVWSILVTLCLLSAAFLFSQMKKLEKITRES